jgi:hypothetical protein
MEAMVRGYLNLYYIFLKALSFKSNTVRWPSVGTKKRRSEGFSMAAEVKQKEMGCFERMEPDESK